MATKAKKSNKKTTKINAKTNTGVSVKSTEVVESGSKVASRRKSEGGKALAVVIGVVCTVAIVILIVCAVMMSKNQLNDSYFVSDGSKYVISLTAEEMGIASEGMEDVPLKMYTVYDYSGDSVTGMRIYYEFENADIAQEVYEEMLGEETEDFESMKTNGKYVVMVVEKSKYEGMTVSDVQYQIDFIEKMRSGEWDASDVEIEETTEEE